VIESKTTLLFVVGLWRSGTSLVQALLNRHPRMALMYEAEPFDLWPAKADAVLREDWPQRLEFYNQTISRHQLDAAALSGRRTAREAALALYCAFAAPRGATIIGEKAPAYCAFLPGIARLFPEARFLVIWRDPAECCRSAAKAGRKNRFFAQKGVMTRMLFGAESLACGVERLHREGSLVQEVEYTEFVAQPESHLRLICEFTQVPFDPRMLDLQGADLSVLPSGEHHDRLRSGAIARTSGGADSLAPVFSAKAQRYAALWSGRYARLGFSRALEHAAAQAGPGWAEQGIDRIKIRYWRGLDAVKRRLFRRIPLYWWGRVRGASSTVAEHHQ
jgi:hypothetical protein